MSILFCLPPTYPVTASSFNYALISLIACIAFGVVYWYFTARFNFHGPKRTVDDLDSDPEFAKPIQPAPLADNESGMYGSGLNNLNGKDSTVVQVDRPQIGQ